MNISRTTTFPLPVPGRQGLVTELKGFSKYIITDDDGSLMTIGELLQAPRGDVIDPSDILWHKANSRSCVFDLMSDTLNATTDVCQFSVRKETIKPHYMQLIPGMYLLFNVSNIWITCREGQPTKHPDCNPCKILLDCGCSLRATEGQLTSETTQGCNGSYQAD